MTPPILPSWWMGLRIWLLPCLWPTLKMFLSRISMSTSLPRWSRIPTSPLCLLQTVAGTSKRFMKSPLWWPVAKKRSRTGRFCSTTRRPSALCAFPKTSLRNSFSVLKKRSPFACPLDPMLVVAPRSPLPEPWP